MKAEALRKNLHSMIDIIEDVDYLKTIQNLLNDKVKIHAGPLSKSEITLLEKRSANAKAMMPKLKSWKEVKKKLQPGQK